jgi:hypothetical protein
MWRFESMNRTSLRSIAAIHGILSAPPAPRHAHAQRAMDTRRRCFPMGFHSRENLPDCRFTGSPGHSPAEWEAHVGQERMTFDVAEVCLACGLLE